MEFFFKFEPDVQEMSFKVFYFLSSGGYFVLGRTLV